MSVRRCAPALPDMCLRAFLRDYFALPPYRRAEAFARLDACRARLAPDQTDAPKVGAMVLAAVAAEVAS